MNNDLVVKLKDIFQCPDTKEELMYVTKGASEGEFINKFETKFQTMRGFVDFVGHGSAKRVTKRISSNKEQTFADLYEDFLGAKNWKSKTFNSIAWGISLNPDLFTKPMKVFLTEVQEGMVLDIPVVSGIISTPVYMDFRRMTFVAVGYSSDCLQKAHGRLAGKDVDNTILIQGEAHKLPLRDGTFDTATSFGGINFIKNYSGAFKEIFRVLKKGAKFTGVAYVRGIKNLTDTIVDKLLLPKNYFNSVFTKDELQKALAAAGFSNISISRFESDTLVIVTATKT
ncbi:MAG: class I SAM-dependent methyltransferase [Candidatus Eremiobacteraeota bacterium]|nr:class I SAM-dependent methyltransferase [Candidatus Eremiobacteraeota bacterium]